MTVRGGWLCDEVGMGKTAVVVGLILASPCTDASTLSQVQSYVPQVATKEKLDHYPMIPAVMLKIKATLVVVPPTLLGQWRDEVHKFAPSLKVYDFHSSFKGEQAALRVAATLIDADVVIVSSFSPIFLMCMPSEPRINPRNVTLAFFGTELWWTSAIRVTLAARSSCYPRVRRTDGRLREPPFLPV